jgi:hypothetical protein
MATLGRTSEARAVKTGAAARPQNTSVRIAAVRAHEFAAGVQVGGVAPG